MENTMVMNPAALPAVRRPTLRRTLDQTIYLLVGLPFSVVVFSATITLVAAGLGLLITLLGIPVLVAAAWTLRLAATGERLTLRRLLVLDAPTPRYHVPDSGDTWLRKQLRVLASPQTYLDLAWGLLAFPLALVGFVVAVVWWSVALAGLSYPLWSWSLPHGEVNGLAELMGLGDSRGIDNLLNVGIGAVALLTLPLAVGAMSFIRSGFSRALLCGRAYMQEEIDEVTGSRDAARSAESAQLARLERDIHDGPQQRLVRLKVDLARAQRQLGTTDPDHPVIAALNDAIAGTQDTLDELRNLSRGIAPQVLTRDGLVAAAHESAARSILPTSVVAEIPSGPGQFAPHVEQTAHFVIAEALTNVAKHSRAEAAQVRLVQVGGAEGSAGDNLLVIVADDGVGGADTGSGHGLAGLAERVRGVGGTLDVSSPDGGPTVLTASLPLGA